jgi:Protein of unknown function (DUF2924)
MRQPVTDAAAIAVEVARIHALAPDGLRPTWRAVFGRTPPASLRTGLLARMIAWHIQARAFGGLDRDTRRFLDSLARAGASPRRQLKPGTVLVRDYQGHTVTVGREGFDWQGTSYSSLSAIARAITGTAWSGPRFFALQGRGAAAKRKRKLAGAHKRQRSAAAGRHGSQPGTAMNDAPVQLRTVAPA